jgi:hypothetical protein
MLLAQCNDMAAAVLKLQHHPEPDVAQKARDLHAHWTDKSERVEALALQSIQQAATEEQS